MIAIRWVYKIYLKNMDSEELTKNADIEKIVREGVLVYESVKNKYETSNRGEFLAIEIESKQEYLGKTSADAMAAARAAHPNKVFYVVKIGFDAAETLAHLFPEK